MIFTVNQIKRRIKRYLERDGDLGQSAFIQAHLENWNDHQGYLSEVEALNNYNKIVSYEADVIAYDAAVAVVDAWTPTPHPQLLPLPNGGATQEDIDAYQLLLNDYIRFGGSAPALPTGSYVQAEVDAYNASLVAFVDFVDDVPPTYPDEVIKPIGYNTQAEVDATVALHDAWVILRDDFIPVDLGNGEFTTFDLPEPEVLLRPNELVAPTVRPIPTTIPTSVDPGVAPLPTNEEIYDQVMQNSKVLKAIVLALNDGSFVPGSNYTTAQIKTGIKNRM